MEGVKNDKEKNLIQLLPAYPLWEIGRIYSYGARKYSENNWRGGMKWTRIYGAALRHLLKWASGKDLDEESGLPHLAHAAFGLLTLLEYSKTYPELDDRPKNQAEIPQMSEVSPVQEVLSKSTESFESDTSYRLLKPEVLEAARYPDTYRMSQLAEGPLFAGQVITLPAHIGAAIEPVNAESDAPLHVGPSLVQRELPQEGDLSGSRYEPFVYRSGLGWRRYPDF